MYVVDVSLIDSLVGNIKSVAGSCVNVGLIILGILVSINLIHTIFSHFVARFTGDQTSSIEFTGPTSRGCSMGDSSSEEKAHYSRSRK